MMVLSGMGSGLGFDVSALANLATGVVNAASQYTGAAQQYAQQACGVINNSAAGTALALVGGVVPQAGSYISQAQGYASQACQAVAPAPKPAATAPTAGTKATSISSVLKTAISAASGSLVKPVTPSAQPTAGTKLQSTGSAATGTQVPAGTIHVYDAKTGQYRVAVPLTSGVNGLGFLPGLPSGYGRWGEEVVERVPPVYGPQLAGLNVSGIGAHVVELEPTPVGGWPKQRGLGYHTVQLEPTPVGGWPKQRGLGFATVNWEPTPVGGWPKAPSLNDAVVEPVPPVYGPQLAGLNVSGAFGYHTVQLEPTPVGGWPKQRGLSGAFGGEASHVEVGLVATPPPGSTAVSQSVYEDKTGTKPFYKKPIGIAAIAAGALAVIGGAAYAFRRK